MFSLSGATKFKYIPNYKDMRGGYDKLRGVVSALDGRMEEGTAYVFTSRNQKLVKIIRHEHNECQLYMQKYDHGMSLTFIETCKLQKKAALDFFNDFFRSVTEGRSDYELIAQEALG